MSSTYNAICLSHDPGLVLGHDFTYEEANSLKSRDRLTGHETCDIVIGRYSYPLVEAACPGRQLPGPTGCKGYHSSIEWIDRDWLRLLATAGPDAHPEALAALGERGCWPLERVRRLRVELGMPEIIQGHPTGADGTLREVLTAFRPVLGGDGRVSGYFAPHPIHPHDFARWTAALGSAQPVAEGTTP